MRAFIAAVFVTVIGIAAFPYGSFELGLSLLPSPTMEAELLLGGEISGFSLESTSIIHWDTWVWQEFSATGDFGPLSVEGRILFGPSTIDFIYDELVLKMSFAGLELAFYAAQLSDAVLGGPASGAALRVTGSFGKVGFESVTEFGATPEGIEIFHAPTGLSREYTTDPRAPGNGLTGQKLSLSGISLPCLGCPDASLELYLTKEEGFEYLTLAVEELFGWCCPEVKFSLEVTFELQVKSVVLEPHVSLAPACFTPYLELDWGDQRLEGLDFAAFEITCDLPNGVLRSVTILKRCCWAISTPEYGSRVVRCFEADEEGIEYYPEYWELISLELSGPACCGEWKATFNAYFGDEEFLFGWNMGYISLEIPLSEGIRLGSILEISTTGIEDFTISAIISW